MLPRPIIEQVHAVLAVLPGIDYCRMPGREGYAGEAGPGDPDGAVTGDAAVQAGREWVGDGVKLGDPARAFVEGYRRL